MKLVVAIIKPFKLDEVRQALTAIGVSGMTVTESRVTAARRAIPSLSRRRICREFSAQAQNRNRCPSNLADKAVDVITSSARTGQIGDGKIFVTRSIMRWRIRTGETTSDRSKLSRLVASGNAPGMRSIRLPRSNLRSSGPREGDISSAAGLT